jgi:tRNA modification GTPase
MKQRRSIEGATICAISTPPGRSAIAVLRLSGKKAVSIVESIFRSSEPLSSYKTHTAHFGEILDPQVQEVIDEVLVLLMRTPYSYTGEDVVEIQCHGNPYLVQKILALLLAEGARLAEPGEFTRRAFLLGRMDLTQAEAVMELISSQSTSHSQWALGQLKGRLSSRITEVRDAVVSLIAEVEASIDFSEDELPLCGHEILLSRVSVQSKKVGLMLADYEKGRQIRQGYRVAILGRPNVGKSSLLNLLLQEDRAIVSPYPGTTRDLLEESIELGGMSVRFVDTAGHRSSTNPIEQEGVRRALKAQQEADLVLFVLDGSEALTEEDLLLGKRLVDVPKIVVVNKKDLPQILCFSEIEEELRGAAQLGLSTLSGLGLNQLRDQIKALLVPGAEKEPPLVGVLRHKVALESAEKALRRSFEAIRSGLSPEFIAIDLRDALDSLGEIVGETTLDDILDKIFGQFCIGK